tara:strand:+ start:608 stop:1285 length:678 start_codon:yes stop_codon:yes gene_type:complete
MTHNLKNRLMTSILLLFLLFIAIFGNSFIFGTSLLILSFITCIEFNNISRKLVGDLYSPSTKFNSKFFVLMWIPFIYMFFIFSLFSYNIYKFQGPIFFLFIVSICFLSDIGGYIFGKTIGGKKLTKISPNKTISGSIGSFIFSLIPIFLFTNLNNFELELNFNNIIFSLIISFVCQLGDLFISYLKRKAKIKDSGKILPGHGGILDRIDGIIFAVPFSYFLIKMI